MISKSWILLLGVGISFAALVSASEENELSENFASASARVIRRAEPGKKKKEKKNMNKKKKEKMNMNKKRSKRVGKTKEITKKGERRTGKIRRAGRLP